MAIVILSFSISLLSYTAKNYGCPDDTDAKDSKPD
jgi:hypothetical protein